MTLNHEKFIYWKEQRIDSYCVTYGWFLADKKTREGVHFHCTKRHDQTKASFYSSNGYGCDCFGIERHSKSPIYEGQRPVKDCHVTGGDCYCDGTSLWAERDLGHICPDGKDDDSIWGVLHGYYYSWIEPRSEAV